MRAIIYHNDADGRCAAAIVARFAKPKMEENVFLPVSYADSVPWETLQKLNPYCRDRDEIWIVDFSFPENEMSKILCILGQDSTFWFDHHESQQDVYACFNNVAGIREIGQASCLAVWRWCTASIEEGPHVVPWPVLWIADRDVWRFAFGDDTINFYEMYLQEENKHPASDLWDTYLGGWGASFYHGYLENGAILRKARMSLLKSFAMRLGCDVNIEEAPDARVLKMNYPGSGDMGEIVRTDLGFDIAWCYHERRVNGAGMVRENNMYSATVDVGSICKARGGGGHKGAAGFVEVL